MIRIAAHTGGQQADVAQPGQLLAALRAGADPPGKYRGHRQQQDARPQHEGHRDHDAGPAALREDPHRVRVADPGRTQHIGPAAVDHRTLLQLENHAACQDKQRHPGQWPPPARRQPPVREQHDQEYQQENGQHSRRPGEPPGQPVREHRPGRRGQPVQSTLLGHHGDRQGQPDQGQQPADGVSWQAPGDQVAGARVQSQRGDQDRVGSHPARVYPGNVQHEQNQPRGQHERGHPG
jgi:hypothetical protein